jgi:hypothetical protein
MTELTCGQCANFVDDPARVEEAFPGVTILGSAYSSVRGDAGICRVFERFMNPEPAERCPSFVERGS